MRAVKSNPVQGRAVRTGGTCDSATAGNPAVLAKNLIRKAFRSACKSHLEISCRMPGAKFRLQFDSIRMEGKGRFISRRRMKTESEFFCLKHSLRNSVFSPFSFRRSDSAIRRMDQNILVRRSLCSNVEKILPVSAHHGICISDQIELPGTKRITNHVVSFWVARRSFCKFSESLLQTVHGLFRRQAVFHPVRSGAPLQS